MPKPKNQFKRPSIDITPRDTAWQVLLAKQVQTDDVVPGVGRVSLVVTFSESDAIFLYNVFGEEHKFSGDDVVMVFGPRR